MSTITQATNDHDFPLEEYISALYNIDDKPFDFHNLTFAELPEHAQEFLLRNDLGDPAAAQQSLTLEIRNAYYHVMLGVRNAEESVIERDTYGVNRAIVSHMSTLTSPPPGQPHSPQDRDALAILQDVLIPEWRSHLDRGLQRIDALIWFEIVLTRGSVLQQPLETHLELRMGDVHCMLTTVTQSLQRINELVKREIVDGQPAEWIDAQVAQTNEDSDSEDDATSDISTPDSNAGGALSDYDENLFSDCEPEPEPEPSVRRCHENITYFDGEREYSYWRGCDFFPNRSRNFIPRSSSSF